MSQFEFSTKEEREAWRVIHDMAPGPRMITIPMFQEAACRFDAREKTCGLTVLSEGHARLIIADSGYASQQILVSKGLVRNTFGEGELTDRGREVLAALNAMCKVQA